MTAKKFDLNIHTHRLLNREPFFAALSRRVDKTPTTSIPTAAVGISKKTGFYELLYNPDFFNSLTDTQILAVLKHEFYHVVFEHLTTRKPSEDPKDMKIWNIATDLAINSYLDGELPEIAVFPGQGVFSHLDPYNSSEWYYEKIQQDEELKNKILAEKINSLDDHGSWNNKSAAGDDSAGSNDSLARERLKKTVSDAVNEAKEANSWGSISESIRKDLVSKFSPASLDWKNVLRYFVKRTQKTSRRSTVKRLNKRYPFVHPGKKYDRVAKVAISVDQSASITDELLTAFFSELEILAKIAEFTVIPFDHEVAEQGVFCWERGKSHEFVRVASGGTNFDAPTDYVNKRSFDGHVIFTDLYAPKPRASKCPRMWVTTPQNYKHPYFETNEYVVSIDNLE